MWSKKKTRRAISTLRSYGELHRGWLVRGFLSTIGVVACRLLMPWPLRGVIEVVFPRGEQAAGSLLVDHLPTGNPVVWLGVVYVLLAAGLGLFEMGQRVNIMRFASNTVHDMRAAAVKGARLMPQPHAMPSGDFITRIIGDSARIKAGLSGIIVHGLQNGLLFISVSAVMLYISIPLGMIFLLAGVMALGIGVYTSSPVAATATKQRKKEGRYAEAISEGMDYGGLDLRLEEINLSSARKEVRTTKIITLSSLYVHIVLAVAVAAALWVGSHGVASGHVSPGELFLFIAYALTVHRRMVQVGRQAARSGKVLACTERMNKYLGYAEAVAGSAGLGDDGEPPVLVDSLRLESVKVASVRGREARARFRRTDLVINSGERIAVIGNMGSGKSTLLQLLSGAELPDKGRLLWDGVDATERHGLLTAGVAYLPQDPVFPPTHVWKLLGLDAPDGLTPEDKKTIERISVDRVIATFPKGLLHKVNSSTLSRNESRLLRLAGILIGKSPSVWALDSPSQGLKGRRARKCISEVLKRAGKRTVVVSMLTPVSLDSFDRVLYMRSGKVAFDGKPQALELWVAERMAARRGEENEKAGS